MLLEGAVAVVTGAGTGLGRQISLQLATEGASVVLAGRSIAAMHDVAKQIGDMRQEALVVPMDLREPSSVEAAAQAAAEKFGFVDVLVNNSGVAGPTKPLWEVNLAEWDDTFRVNVTGAFLAIRAFAPGMMTHRRGSIVIIGSMTGKRPLLNRTPYAASKTALIGLVRTLAWELGPFGVRVNLISPGGVEGERLDRVIAQQASTRNIPVDQARAEFAEPSPLGRLVRPREVADAVVHLASPRAAATTGEDVNVSAGVVMY